MLPRFPSTYLGRVLAHSSCPTAAGMDPAKETCLPHAGLAPEGARCWDQEKGHLLPLFALRETVVFREANSVWWKGNSADDKHAVSTRFEEMKCLPINPPNAHSARVTHRNWAPRHKSMYHSQTSSVGLSATTIFRVEAHPVKRLCLPIVSLVLRDQTPPCPGATL